MKYAKDLVYSKKGRYFIRLTKLYVKMHASTGGLRDEDAQDLVEYALVLALIALAATASMNGVATAIGTAFTAVGGHLSSYTS
jgi:pilus assembly protein Flp/PilA